MKHRLLFTFLLLATITPILLHSQTTLQFSGLTWYVKSGSGGPGPNNWSDSHESVWVDQNGYLHLKIRKQGDTWLCSEIYTRESFGFGKYKFLVYGNVEEFDPNVVAGLFTYENDEREIDIEFAGWGDPESDAGWYTIQPPPYNNSQYNFALNLSNNLSTHQFQWDEDSIQFQSFRGHQTGPPSTDSLITQWTYRGNKNPPAGNERLHLNFWLMGGNAPVNQQEAELIIRAVFVPGQPQEVETILGEAELKVYPVPAKKQLNVGLTDGQQLFDVSLYNPQGNLVSIQQSCKNSTRFDVSGLATGIYFVVIQSNGQYTGRKILIDP
ncbi:MAG: T9SS type A sorting domain-containing protein [Lentimicrobium sp.]